MSVVSCPKCSGQVTMPADARTDGWVRCPICRAEYRAYHLLEFVPPEVELIDAPAHPFDENLPTWDAVAAASTAPDSALAASEIAAPAADLSDSLVLETSDELAVAPVGATAGAITAAECTDDSNVFTFDDSLLLDEPTDELPDLRSSNLAGGAEEPSDLVAIGEAETDDQSDWHFAVPVEPPPLVQDASMPVDDLRATDDHRSAVTIFDQAGSPPVTSVPPIGLAPRRKSRRRNPVLMVLGVVGGGFLGLVIGYGILMWLFDPPKDPLRIAPQLPEFMVPKALRSAGEMRAAQTPHEDQTSSDTATLRGEDESSDPSSKQSFPDKEQLPPLEPFGEADATGPSKAETYTDRTVESPHPTNTPPEAAKNKAVPQKDPLADVFGESTTRATKASATEPLTNPFDAVAADETSKAGPPAADGGHSTNAVHSELPDQLGPVSDKHYTPDELLATVAAAKPTTESALTLPVDADAAQKKSVNGPFYVNLCKVAESLTFLEPPQDKQREGKATTAAIESILNAVPDRSRLEELGKLAGYWYERPPPTDKNYCKGIVLSGMVKQSKQRGKLVESVVETLGPPRELRVVSPSALTDDPSRPVLVIGAIIKDAAQNLRGYEGAATTVVWAAMAIDPTAPSRSGAMP